MRFQSHNKEKRYRALVDEVRIDYLTREMSSNSKGVYLKWNGECHEINLWTYWQGIGNYDARIMLVGQDWGCPDPDGSVMESIRRINSGISMDYSMDQTSPTDRNLCRLFSVLGYDITQRCNDLFFTNLVLGYRSKGVSGNLRTKWMVSDRPYFSRLVNIIEPKVIICLGKDTFTNALAACTDERLRIKSFNAFICGEDNPVVIRLESGKKVAVFAAAHCGTIGTMNRNRADKTEEIKNGHNLDLQIQDWTRIRNYLRK